MRKKLFNSQHVNSYCTCWSKSINQFSLIIHTLS